ncbi:MAG TPA: CheR family methyltransferase [Thermoleophilaceae bacterium]|jgi:two-component system CheB/CheR fusion protein
MSADSGLQPLLDYLKQSRGFDFGGYKRSSLERRIQKRMADVGIASYQDYQDHLEVTPDEFTDLFNTILINVTDFFRDKPAWDYVAEEVVPTLLERIPDPQPIRVWSAGCASGEEAYTAAMILSESLGEEEFRRRVKVYATDVDEEALTIARAATYARDALKSVPEGLPEKYFQPTPLGYVFRPELRRSVIFGRNDLVQDAPISRIDLLISRNALMYFTPEAQGRILGHFNFALNETGFLFLGRSEMLVTHTDLFTPHHLKWRVFTKVPRAGLRERLSFVTDAPAIEAEQSEQRYSQLRAAALEIAPEAVIVVDPAGFVAAINQRARVLFDLGPAHLGRPLQDLELSYRPADLRTPIGRATEERKRLQLGRMQWTPRDGEQMTLEVTVTPMAGEAGQFGAMVIFEDVTEHARLDEEHDRAKRQLETAYEELQSTVEELETTNEELHSTNEELETTNEELQSSNEELETMNEELSSTNDELESVNTETQARSIELDRVNMFLEGILGSLGVGVVVIDREQTVQVWNASSMDLWGLRPDEVEGKPLLSLDINLPLGELREPISTALGGTAEPLELTLDAVNRRGRGFRCWVRVLPLRDSGDEPYGAILLMADREKAGELVSS